VDEVFDATSFSEKIGGLKYAHQSFLQSMPHKSTSRWTTFN